MNLEEMKSADLVVLAQSKGHNVRGMTRAEVIDTLQEQPAAELEREDPTTLSWRDLQAMAKSLGIKTYGKKREQIEAEINEGAVA